MDKQDVALTCNGLVLSLKKDVPHAVTQANLKDTVPDTEGKHYDSTYMEAHRTVEFRDKKWKKGYQFLLKGSKRSQSETGIEGHGCSSVAQHLPVKHNVLSSIPSLKKEKKKKGIDFQLGSREAFWR